MAEEVTISNKVEAAIIKSFDYWKLEKLPRQKIIIRVHKLTGESEGNIAKRITKLKNMNYLIWHERYGEKTKEEKKRWGVYSVNAKYEFKFECEQLPSEVKPIEDKYIEIPLKNREDHTKRLKDAIENWISNFPNPPHLEKAFPRLVEKCEDHLWFSDLYNHLPASGFDVLEKWEKYKKDIQDLDKFESDLSKMMQQDISKIFDGLELRFVESYNSLESDCQCSLPHLILRRAIESEVLNINAMVKLKNAETGEKYEEIMEDTNSAYSILEYEDELIEKMPLIEKDDSLLWGFEPENLPPSIQILRLPKRDKEAFMRGKDQAISYFIHPPPTIKIKASELGTELKRLVQERENMLKELKRLMQCQCFSGDCRYLSRTS